MQATNVYIYITHFLSCWGNRMWQFGMGMFLVRIANDTIQLTATFGLVSGLAIFFLGALVGDWIDTTPRLKAAQISLVLQDVFMLGCAMVVTGYLASKDNIPPTNTWLLPLLQALIVTLGVLSALAAQARIIAVERDWIVEICGKDTDLLASMTAMLRRIDQVSMILAPMATGQVMTYMGLMYGAIFISVWNIVSVFVEVFLTWKVYNTVPALMAKKNTRRSEDPQIETDMETGTTATDTTATTTSTTDDKKSNKIVSLCPDNTTSGDSGGDYTDHHHHHHHHYIHLDKKKSTHYIEDQQTCLEPKILMARASSSRVLYQCITLYRGGKTYISYRVALAGLALAFLYMTVLDFHNITVGYAITQGLSESVVGILQGSSAVFGILGTFAYPLIRRRTGLHRTGFIALSCQVSCLTLCVVSVWMPGSPFDPFYRRSSAAAQTSPASERCGPFNGSDDGTGAISSDYLSQAATTLLPSNRSHFTDRVNDHNDIDYVTMNNNNNNNISNSSSTVLSNACKTLVKRGPDSYVSVGFLMAGVFLARFGVWVADLTITQLFLEKVIHTERGIVNGVQSSINQLMDLLKYGLVVILPDTETFGFLIILSFCSIATAWLLYLIFMKRERVAVCACRGSGHGCGDEEDRDASQTACDGGDDQRGAFDDSDYSGQLKT